MTFKDIFPGLSGTLNFNFQDFPGPGIFPKKKNPGLSRRRGNPVFYLFIYYKIVHTVQDRQNGQSSIKRAV